jgi:nucleoside 2-deoxyribosyltransferase
MRKVYLAGPISGLTFGEAEDWRIRVANALTRSCIESFSPLRAKEFLVAHGELHAEGWHDHVLTCPRGIMSRDHWDCQTNCDAIFVNLLGAKKVSIGTVMEIGCGFAYRKPVIVVMEKTGNLHDHAMVNEATNYRVETLEEGIMVTRALFNL